MLGRRSPWPLTAGETKRRWLKANPPKGKLWDDQNDREEDQTVEMRIVCY
jgi:hypothetical protein